MDFLYADLNEIVDPFAYTVEKTDNTVMMDIDNNKRTITAKVIYTPGQLTINNGLDEVISFNGSTNKTVLIPLYKIVRVQPDNGDIRSLYVLMKWDFSKEQYVQVDGDTIYLEEQIDELNIENGSISDLDSKKIGTGNSSISSVKYKHNGVDVFVPIMNSAVDNNNQLNDSVKIVGLKSGKEIHGGTETGVQSLAFGGLPYGISQQATLCVTTTTSGSEWYDIISEQPLVLKSIVSENSQNITEDIVNGKYNSTINLPIDGGILFVIIRQNGRVESISPYNVLQRNSIHTKIIRGDEQCPTAKGNQSVSIGGGTQADYNWSQAFGLGTITSRPGQMAVGMYNELEPDALLIVGNGYYDALTGDIHRSNAAAIMRDGSIKTYNNNGNNNQVIIPDEYKLWYEEASKSVDNALLTMNTISNDLLEKIDTDYYRGLKGEAGSIKFIPINELPTENIDENAVYLVPVADSTDENRFTEYTYIDGKWETIGAILIQVDHSEFVKFTEISKAVKVGITDDTEEWSPDDKAKACETIGAVMKLNNEEGMLSGLGSAYVADGNNNTVLLPITELDASPNTIVKRGSRGEVRVATPENDGDATPKKYVDEQIAALVNSAPATLDTLKELADAILENADVVDTLDKAIADKVDKTSLATEEWTFYLETGTPVKKVVYVATNPQS